MIVYTPVVGGDTAVSIPKAGVRKMACALFQRGAASALVDLDGQADSRNFEGPQVSGAVIEVRGDRGKAGLRPASPVHIRVDDTSGGADQAAVECAGAQIGGQRLAGAGEVAGGGTKGRGNKGGVFTAVHIDRLLLIDGSI